RRTEPWANSTPRPVPSKGQARPPKSCCRSLAVAVAGRARRGLTAPPDFSHVPPARELLLRHLSVLGRQRRPRERAALRQDPGSRAAADPNAAKARKLARELPELTDEEIALAVSAITKARAKAAKSAA